MRDEHFEWDDDKARENVAKHKIDFEDARHVFGDAGMIDDVTRWSIVKVAIVLSAWPKGVSLR